MNPFVIPVGIVLAVLLLLLLLSIRVIPNNRIGIVEKRFSAKGSVTSGFIALNGEAGFQPNVLRGGWHFLIPFQYVVHMAADRDHSPGQDRVRVRPRWRGAGRLTSAGLEPPGRGLHRRGQLSEEWRTARTAAADPA